MKPRTLWQWTAAGKHPVARDFIEAGSPTQLSKAFSDWIAQGYHRLGESETRRLVHQSWRFWAGAGNRKDIACGLIKDSSDTLGRPYPLLILGTGPLNRWQERWPSLLIEFREMYMQMEGLASRRFAGFKPFEEAVRGLPASGPRSSTGSTEGGKGMTESGGEPADVPAEPDIQAWRAETGGTAYVLPLQSRISGGEEQTARRRLLGLRAVLAESPQAVFAGGSPDRVFLAVFLRGLTPADFARLWLLPLEERPSHGPVVSR
ncbi:hypothetical protein TRIP_B40443 [uncultured Desulfatiglans sp.]|nr:hypothetical protein TRIP_B40443 [uncultured Desulfatiglans sp.]